MEKQALNPNIFIPLAGLFGLNDNPNGLPQLSSDSATNKILWNSAGNAVTLTATIAGIKVLANSLARKELDKRRSRVHENKVNAMHAYSTPNTAPQVDAVERVRALGINKGASAATVALPLVIAAPAAMGLTSLISGKLKENAEEALDEKLAAARNELDALHAKLLKLRLKKSSSALEIPASIIDADEDEDEDDEDEDDEDEDEGASTRKRRVRIRPVRKGETGIPEYGDLRAPYGFMSKAASEGLVAKGLGTYILAAALVAGLTGATVYNMTKDKDKERKRKKLLEKQVFAQNLTNTPNQVELLLGKHAPFPTDESRQTYIKEISDSVNSHA